MTASFLLPITDCPDCLCAVFEQEKAVLASPSFFAHLGEQYRPPLEEGESFARFFSDPVPYVASRRDFLLCDKAYTLFTVALLGEDASKEEAVSTLCKADAALNFLLSFTQEKGTGSFCVVMDLFNSVCELLRSFAPDSVRSRVPLYKAGSVILDRSSLSLALGLIAPDLLSRGDLEVALTEREGIFPTVSLYGRTPAIAPFTRQLVGALAECGGFFVEFLQDRIDFVFCQGEPSAHVLYAGTSESEWLACMRIALLLRGAL